MKAVSIEIPPDKSISHRAVMFASISEGVTRIKNILMAEDIKRTIDAFRAMGVNIRLKASLGFARDRQCSRVSVKGPVKLRSPGAINIPGDISSAAFFIVAGCILPDTKITIKNVGLNPTRTGIIDILKRMGADVQLRKLPCMATCEVGQVSEPAGDIIVKSSRLKGVSISSKETDRVHSMVTNLRKIGADIKLEPKREHIVINGGKPLHGAKVSSFGDHRTAMSMLVAGLGAKCRVIVTGLDCIDKSFPNFLNLLNKLN